jgi:hypothetical protein
MDTRHEQQNPSDDVTGQRASNELVKVIRKLRWLGMEEEARKVENQLIQRDVPAADSVAAASRVTD